MAENSGIRLIVGLGNPGAEYARTRHNVGFWFVDELARRQNTFFREERKFLGEVCRVRLSGRDVWLLKPNTFMNLSGNSVVALALYYKILPDEILVVHDELDIAPGLMKFKKAGSNAGHNGLKDITAKLSTPDFWRLRIGTGHPRALGMVQQVSDFVLSAPNAEHEASIRSCIDAGLKEVDLLAKGDMTAVLRRLAHYGSMKKEKKPQKKNTKKAEKSEDKVSEFGVKTAAKSETEQN